MNDITTNIKRQLLKYLNKLDDPSLSNLTITELREILRNDVDKYDAEKLKLRESLSKDFKNVYLKKHDTNGIFGEELQVFHVKSIEFECFDTDYNENYAIDGERISFSKLGVNVRKLSDDASDLVSEQDLRDCTKITRAEYKTYKESATLFNKNLYKLIKG